MSHLRKGEGVAPIATGDPSCAHQTGWNVGMLVKAGCAIARLCAAAMDLTDTVIAVGVTYMMIATTIVPRLPL